MFLRKSPALPLIAAIAGASALPAFSQVTFDLSTDKAFRQYEEGSDFRGGQLTATLLDGGFVYIGGCARPAYWPPNIPLDPCPGGSTAFLTFGDAGDANSAAPYFWVTDIQPAIVIEPRLPQLCSLIAAPASELRRPLGGFRDRSVGLYFNLHTTQVSEYLITRYNYSRNYTKNQEGRFFKEIVPGVYHYEFPRLDNPVLRARISPVVYPLPNGPAKINNKKTGVRFDDKGRWGGKRGYSGRWNKKGYFELSYIYPNTIKWEGFTPNEVYPAIDDLFFSIRYLSQPGDARSDITYTSPTGDAPASIFPAYINGGDPRVLLPSPYTREFTLPPVLPSGTKGLVELELNRYFQTGTITVDSSNRYFQLPVMVVNYFNEFAELAFGRNTKKTDLLDDFDGDGVNNLTEWILESNASDDGSVPIPPRPASNAGPAPKPILNRLADHPDTLVSLYAQFQPEDLNWYGFMINKQRSVKPGVKYILQRSTNNGRTWRRMKEDGNWYVVSNKNYIGIASKDYNSTVDPPLALVPGGTAGHQYRIKIVLKDKKKSAKKKSAKNKKGKNNKKNKK